MKIFNLLKGKNGENIAKNYLKKQGYRIIDTNYKTKIGEIDIVAMKDKVLSFIEVKSRYIIEVFLSNGEINHIKSAF